MAYGQQSIRGEAETRAVLKQQQHPTREAELRAALTAALVPIQRLYDLTGAPDLKPVLDQGQRALRR